MNKDVKPDCETPFDMAVEKKQHFHGLNTVKCNFLTFR